MQRYLDNSKPLLYICIHDDSSTIRRKKGRTNPNGILLDL